MNAHLAKPIPLHLVYRRMADEGDQTLVAMRPGDSAFMMAFCRGKSRGPCCGAALLARAVANQGRIGTFEAMRRHRERPASP
jgi:hypothetical protein